MKLRAAKSAKNSNVLLVEQPLKKYTKLISICFYSCGG